MPRLYPGGSAQLDLGGLGERDVPRRPARAARQETRRTPCSRSSRRRRRRRCAPRSLHDGARAEASGERRGRGARRRRAARPRRRGRRCSCASLRTPWPTRSARRDSTARWTGAFGTPAGRRGRRGDRPSRRLAMGFSVVSLARGARERRRCRRARKRAPRRVGMRRRFSRPTTCEPRALILPRRLHENQEQTRVPRCDVDQSPRRLRPRCSCCAAALQQEGRRSGSPPRPAPHRLEGRFGLDGVALRRRSEEHDPRRHAWGQGAHQGRHDRGDRARSTSPPKDLTQSRGLVRIDLRPSRPTRLARTTTRRRRSTPSRGSKSASATRRARRCAGPTLRFAGSTAPAPPDLTKVEAPKTAQSDVRTVTMTVHGDVLIHGHQIQKDGLVDVRFPLSFGGCARLRGPTKIEIKSKEPMHVVLKELDVRPRDPAGQLLDWTTKLISKVAETADVTVDLAAILRPTTAAAP